MRLVIWLGTWIVTSLGWTLLICIAIWMLVTVTFKAVEMLATGGMP